jgi:UDP-N-acetylmuramoyl-tripeptide--D-alanyl-D-alanine ligase
VVNGDSPLLAAALDEGRRAGRIVVRRIKRFGRSGADLDLRLTQRVALAAGQEFVLADGGRFSLRLDGEHNALNAMAAIAVARAMGLPDRAIAEGLAAVRPESMRLERVEMAGMLVFNDAYNANPDAMAASLRAFAEVTSAEGDEAIRRVVILGEMLELGAAAADCHREVGRLLAEINRTVPVHAVGVVGRHADSYAAGLRDGGWQGDLAEASDLDAEGVRRIRPLLRPGDRVLVKGSRGAAMERLLAAVAAEVSADAVLASGGGASR